VCEEELLQQAGSLLLKQLFSLIGCFAMLFSYFLKF